MAHIIRQNLERTRNQFMFKIRETHFEPIVFEKSKTQTDRPPCQMPRKILSTSKQKVSQVINPQFLKQLISRSVEQQRAACINQKLRIKILPPLCTNKETKNTKLIKKPSQPHQIIKTQVDVPKKCIQEMNLSLSCWTNKSSQSFH